MASDLNKRMQQTAKGRSTGAAREKPFQEAPKLYNKRLTLDLTEADFKALKMDSVEAGMPMANILRGLIAVFRDDETLKKEAVRRAEAERGR